MSDDVIYLDTSIIVTPLLKNREPEVLARCEAALERAAQGANVVVTSWLTWDESTWAFGRAAGRFDRQRAHSLGEALLAVEFLQFIPLNRQIVALANELLGSTGCRPRDCLHAATAILHAGGRLASLDSDFRAQQLARHGLVVLDP